MLQRIQSLYLLLLTVSCVVFYFIPIATYSTDFGILTFDIFGGDIAKIDIPNTIFLILINSLIAILTIAIIFLYKKRKLQIKLLMIDMLLALALVAVLYIIVSAKIENLPEILSETQYQIGAFLPLLNIIFIILTNRSIRKDEVLVRSADRLR